MIALIKEKNRPLPAAVSAEALMSGGDTPGVPGGHNVRTPGEKYLLVKGPRAFL